MDGFRRNFQGERSPDRPRRTSPPDHLHRAYNRRIDQPASTSSDSNPARPLGQTGDNGQKQDISTLNIEQLVDNINKIIHNVELKTLIIKDNIKMIKSEWEKHTSGEKVLSGLELEEFGRTVKAAKAELKTLVSSTLPDLKTNLEAYQTEYNSRTPYPIREKNLRMEELKKISSVAGELVVDHLVDLALISQKVELRQNRNRVMKDSIPWVELDEMFKKVVNDTLEKMEHISYRDYKNTEKNINSKYEKFKKNKIQELCANNEIGIIYDLIKNRKKMEKEGKTIEEIEDNLDKLYQERLKKENKQSKDIIQLSEKKQGEVRKEIEKFINKEVPGLTKIANLIPLEQDKYMEIVDNFIEVQERFDKFINNYKESLEFTQTTTDLEERNEVISKEINKIKDDFRVFIKKRIELDLKPQNFLSGMNIYIGTLELRVEASNRELQDRFDNVVSESKKCLQDSNIDDKETFKATNKLQLEFNNKKKVSIKEAYKFVETFELLYKRLNNTIHKNKEYLQSSNVDNKEIYRVIDEYKVMFAKEMVKSIEDAEKIVEALEKSLKVSNKSSVESQKQMIEMDKTSESTIDRHERFKRNKDGTSRASAVESGEPSRRSRDGITEASSGTSREGERRRGKAPISDSQSDERFAEVMRKDLKINFHTNAVPYDKVIMVPPDVSETCNRINNELESIKSSLQKADNLSSDFKLDILSALRGRHEQIHENWTQAITVDRRGKGNNDQRLEAAKRLKENLKYLESMKNYIQKGELLVGSNTVGKENNINRDYCFNNSKKRIFGVFDGVGSNKGSDLASKSASNFIKSKLETSIADNLSLEKTKELINRALIDANNGLNRQKGYRPELSGMATTALVANVMKDGTVVVGNVGDCRALLIKRKSKDIEHLTLDNSTYNQMQLIHEKNTRDELLGYQKQIAHIKDFTQIEDSSLKSMIRHRNDISSCLGKEDGVYVDMYEHKMERGDILILASDGITDNLTDQQIHRIIQENKWNPGKATEDLVQKAKEISQRGKSRSKPDDMTVVIATY